MKECPICHIDMLEKPKYGVMIDICPRCNGIWLDRGELQKIISLAREFEDEHESLYELYRKHPEYHHHYYKHYHHKKKKHPLFKLIEEIFD